MWRLSRDKQKEDTRHLQARACWGAAAARKKQPRIVLEQILLSLLRRKERHLCLYTNFWGERWDFICSFTGNKIMRKRKKEKKKEGPPKRPAILFPLSLSHVICHQTSIIINGSIFVPTPPPPSISFSFLGRPLPTTEPYERTHPGKELPNYGIGSAVWFVLILVITFMGC